MRFIFPILLLFFINCSNSKTKYAKPIPAADLAEYRKCTTDKDCIYVNNGCCDCANGGEEIAINNTKKSDFLNLFDCQKTACTKIARIPACGTGTVSCESGLCVFTIQQN